ncbi:MAG: glycosyltransferase family 2 protein [Desulfomonilaceae bacterium]|nr:glycosyltransferase family 2 protein [Desulfomonilaceae bacterium]
MVTRTTRSGPLSLDIIIPAYNEGEMLARLFDRLDFVFSESTLRDHGIRSVTYIFVDDGSRDSTSDIIARRIAEGLSAKLVMLSRNFGHQAAITAGMEQSQADLLAVMDADLQDPPETILDMFQKWREGYDVVYGIRKKRKENPFVVAGYWLFYRLVRLMSEVSFPADAGDFCLMDKKVVDAIRSLPERLRFHRGMRAWVGFRQTGVEYDRPPRIAGKSKYSLHKLYSLATDGIAWLSLRPLKITQFLSFVLFVVTLTCSTTIAIGHLTTRRDDELALWLSLLFVFISLGFSVISFCLYVLSAYVGRSYLEAKARPTYIIQELICGKSVRSEQASGSGPAVPREE